MSKSIYLDYAATTPVDPKVADAMRACLSAEGCFGNPGSSTHRYGWEAKERIDTAREQVAAGIKADPKTIVWTSGATEANNLAIKGYALAHQDRGRHIITAQTEHKAVLDVCGFLETQGFSVTYLKSCPDGLLSLASYKAAIRPDTILASIMLVNNETGVIQDIPEFAEIAHQHEFALHVDAAQAVGKIRVDVNALDADLLSLSAHKVYGPKGCGALYVRRRPRIKLQALIHGGGQELGLRAGTLATHQIVGMGEAFALADVKLPEDFRRIAGLQQQLWQGIAELPQIYRNGRVEDSVPHIVNISFAGVDGEALLMALQELAVSSGSACTSASMETSHVLRAMGVSDTLAHSTIRFSLGRYTTPAEIARAVALIKHHVDKLRSLSPLWKQP